MEGLNGLGSWPLPDSHFYSCICKPIKCDLCEATMAEKEMHRHRQHCLISTSAGIGSSKLGMDMQSGQGFDTTGDALADRQHQIKLGADELCTTPGFDRFNMAKD